jgi:dipeptidyl aminopeptidase/acylaminoacyl peptidase
MPAQRAKSAASAAKAASSLKLNPVVPEDLYSLRQCFSCVLSPDNSLLATVIDGNNREENKKFSNIWLQGLNARTGKGQGKLRQFTRGEFADSSPRFSPDGRLIAFLSNRSEKSQLHLIPVDGGESWQLTHLPGNVAELAWAPDGKSIAIVFSPQDKDAAEREKLAKQGKKGVDQPAVREIDRIQYRLDGFGFYPQGRSELHIVDVSSGKARLLLNDGKDNSQICWSPDGKWLVFVSNKSEDPDLDYMKSQIWRMRSDGVGKAIKVHTFEGPQSSPAVSPDGKWIAFRGWADPKKHWNEADSRLWVVPFVGGIPRRLGQELDRPVDNSCLNDTWGIPPTAPPVWNTASDAVFSIISNEGTAQIWRFELEKGAASPVWQHKGVVIDYAFDFAGSNLYATFSEQYNPGDIFAARLDETGQAGALQQLSSINSSWLSRKSLGQVQEVWLKGSGGRLQGWVMTPPGFNSKKSYPTILYIHGGPAAAYPSAYFHEFQYLAGQGYVVIYSNPRGGTSYGEAHKAAISKGWGKEDYHDLMRFADHCQKEFSFIDKARMGVAGGSYGGYMTNWIIGHTQRFAAAVTDRCVSNWLSMFGSSDFGWHFIEGLGHARKSPFELGDLFVEMSPISHMHKCKTPTLIIHQENDLRCPIEQAEQVYTVLKLKGVDTRLLRYPQESHGMSRGGRIDRRIHRLKAISGWFEKYLKK